MGPRVKAEGDNVRGGTLPCDHSCRLVAERSPLPHQPALAQHDFLEGALVVGGLGGEVHEGGVDLLGQRVGLSDLLQHLFVDLAEAGDDVVREAAQLDVIVGEQRLEGLDIVVRSEEHTSELQSLMRISYAVFCLKKK